MTEISGELTGTSPAIRALQADIEVAAACDAKVLITGDTGTGREVTARQIHARSQRRARAFVAINCGGIPETLLESELFGHFLCRYSQEYRMPIPRLTSDAFCDLFRWEWAGNVRELKNVAERLVVRGYDRPVTIADLPLG